MITALSSMDELKEAKKAVDQLKQSCPDLFDKWVHAVNLTRALQLKYHYMGCLLMDEDPSGCQPAVPCSSVIHLYEKEIQAVKNDVNISRLKQLFTLFKKAGYAKISLLALGRTPESLVGASSIK